MTTNTFRSNARGLSAPVERAVAITPDNDATLTIMTRALYVGGAGNLRVLTAGGDDVTLSGIQAGSMIPIRVVKVFATSTTATAIVGLW